MNENLVKEFKIKKRLGRTPEQIRDELEREGFQLCDIEDCFRYVKEAPWYECLLGPSWKCALAAFIPMGIALYIILPTVDYRILAVSWSIAFGLFMVIAGSVMMSRANSQASWISIIKIGGWVQEMMDLDDHEREDYKSGIMVGGVGFVTLFLLPWVMSILFQ